ncbi:MAG: 6,7-dimethyl-8-ribityllumazine synthase [Saprospiraceae bacterium]|jgi:6,7-dimethyl-8-ribityllumazine synthase|tara:strand:- start:384 stop:905 length:522 start_codon:yes stop_codon:yes gene_type:complete
MASALKNLSDYNEANIPSVEGQKFGIIVADYHTDITYALYEACHATLLKHGAKEEDIHTVQVPGTYELPTGARMLAQSKSLDAYICLGCVIKGDTPHNDYINSAVANALMTMSVSSGKAFIFGVVTPNTHQQAVDRSGGKHGNKGIEAAIAAIRMVDLKKSLGGKKSTIGFGH